MGTIGRVFYSIFFYLVALSISTAALMWFVNDTFAWSYWESWSVMLGIFIGCSAYQIYDIYISHKRDEWADADRRERTRNEFLDYHNKP